MWFTLTLTPLLRQQLYRRLHQAYASGALRLVKRVHALLAMAEGRTVCEVAQMLNLGEQTVRDYLKRFLWQGVASLVYRRPPGRPSKRTKTQRQALAALIEAGRKPPALPPAAGVRRSFKTSSTGTLGWNISPIISVPYWTTSAFRIRKRALSLPILMRQPGWSGVRPPGLRCSGKHASAKPCCCSVMRPVLLNGAP